MSGVTLTAMLGLSFLSGPAACSDARAHSSLPVAGHCWVKALKTVYSFASDQLDYEGRNPAKGIDTTPSRPRQRVLRSQAER